MGNICNRYFFKNTGSTHLGYAPSIGDNYRHELYYYPEVMRTAPTLTHTWGGGSNHGAQYVGNQTADLYVNMGNTSSIVNLTSVEGDAEL